MKYIMPVNMAICFHRLRSTVIRCVFNQRMLRTQGLKARVLTKPVRFCSFRGSGLQVSRHCLQSVVNHFLTVLLSDVADCNPYPYQHLADRRSTYDPACINDILVRVIANAVQDSEQSGSPGPSRLFNHKPL